MKLLTLLFVSLTLLQAKRIHTEKYYQNIICNKFKAQKEFVLQDKTRVDCLTSNYAIEIDFANKWSESIGQSLYYSIKTGKRAVVVLITEHRQKDTKYLKRLLSVAKEHNIRVYTIGTDNVIELRLK